MAQSSSSGPAQTGRFSETWHDWLRVGVPGLLVAVAAFAIAWHFVKPAPPSHVVIATGSKQGRYFAVAQKYADSFAANGITLEVRETAGSGENFKLLNDPASGVDIAIVQAGSSPAPSERPRVQAVAGIYYEPVIIFYRGDGRMTQLCQLAGKRIATGADGSGVRIVARMLLEEAGVHDQAGGTAFVETGGDAAADALSAGQVDAAFYVIAPDAAVIARLLGTPGVHMMSFDHAHAYGRRHPFLSATTLYQGSVDLAKNLPESDVQLIAAPATIVVRDSIHQGIVQLLVRAAQEVNAGATLLSDPGAFPIADRTELPANKDALYFLANKPSILHRTLPFWLASMVDRLIILLVPLLVVLVPLIRLMPPLFRWRVQRRIDSRYKRVRQIEEKLGPAAAQPDVQAGREELLGMEKDLAALKLPASFAQQLYHLRTHVTYVRNRFDAWLARPNTPSATS